MATLPTADSVISFHFLLPTDRYRSQCFFYCLLNLDLSSDVWYNILHVKKSNCSEICWLVHIGQQIRVCSRENAKILQHRACNMSLLLIQHWIILLFFHPLGFLSPSIVDFAGTLHVLDNALWYDSSCRVEENEVFKLEGKILHVFSLSVNLAI